LEERYPDLNLKDLEDHVERTGRRRHSRKPEIRLNASDRHRMRAAVNEQEEQPAKQGQQGAWREPRQPASPPPNVASSSSGGNPVKLEPTAGEQAISLPVNSDAESVDAFTVLASDESDASIFGLRSTLHEVEEIDELSDSSSHEGDERAVAEKERVDKWRTDNILLDDLDFAYVFTDFEEAYSNAGRAVAMAWSRARILAEPEMVSDMARISAVEATATKIRRVDELRNATYKKKKLSADASSLRQPGKGTEAEEKDVDKNRFIEPLAQLMMDCQVGREENASATDEEIMNSLRRKATRVVGAAEIPTLHRAITTADEVRKYLEGRASHMRVCHVEPIVLEEFLWQSRARCRAVNAISWMCRNLQLGWPIDKVEKPDTKKASLIGTECKQAPAAQPGMLKALSDVMVTGAETSDPTWLAHLASWLQAMANLRLGHVLRRSVPVERYNGWMLFFCKRGKQKHNRAGFYWGVPSETSCGYDWTVKFLEVYNQRRHSDVGREMMGMIFRTDTFGYLSAKAVNALSMDAVAGILENPEELTTYSWRRMLPTLALHLNFSRAERLAIGDWTDAKALGDEAPITLRYAEGKEGKSRTCKLVCAAVLSQLASKDIRTFDELPALQWGTLAGEARAKVESKPLDVNVLWRNPDIAESGGGFKMKRAQIAFPKQLAGVPLAPSSRDGQRYCVDFQTGTCRESDACQLGIHKCAAVFRSGRTCHGRHPGMDCRHTKKHAAPQEANPEEAPPLKKARVDEPENCQEAERAKVILKEAPKKAAKFRAPLHPEVIPLHVEDDSIMRRLLPRLREERYDRRGNRLNPEPPRLVAKVCEEKGSGELWLGPLPTPQRLDTIAETKHSIQIHCFLKDPADVQVERGGEFGMRMPGTLGFRCEMSNPQARVRDMRALKSCLVNSLWQGDNAYVHCVSGISRAPMAASVMIAMAMGISFERAKDIVNQTRNVSFQKGEMRMQGDWIEAMLREGVTRAVVPTGFSCRVSNPNEVVVHATTVVVGSTEPICRWKKGAAGKQDFKGDIITVASIEEASNQFGGRFCVNCEALLRASLRLQVEEFFG